MRGGGEQGKEKGLLSKKGRKEGRKGGVSLKSCNHEGLFIMSLFLSILHIHATLNRFFSPICSQKNRDLPSKKNRLIKESLKKTYVK